MASEGAFQGAGPLGLRYLAERRRQGAAQRLLKFRLGFADKVAGQVLSAAGQSFASAQRLKGGFGLRLCGVLLLFKGPPFRQAIAFPVFLKIGLEIPIVDGSWGHVLHEKLELLNESSTNHRIVSVEASAERFPIKDLLPEPCG